VLSHPPGFRWTWRPVMKLMRLGVHSGDAQ
jgi:hypothetical protein